MSKHKIEQYTKNQTTSFDGLELLLQAFSAIVRGMKKGKKAIEEKDYLEQHRVLTASSNLLAELQNSLPETNDMQDLRKTLLNIFEYSRKKIIGANKDSDTTPLEKVEHIFKQMYSVTDDMKLLPNFSSVKKQYDSIQEERHSQARFSMQQNLEQNNDDIARFITTYQESNYKKEQDLELYKNT